MVVKHDTLMQKTVGEQGFHEVETRYVTLHCFCSLLPGKHSASTGDFHPRMVSVGLLKSYLASSIPPSPTCSHNEDRTPAPSKYNPLCGERNSLLRTSSAS